MPQNIFDRSEKEEFLDNYFLLRLQQLLSKINTPELKSRKDHVESIFDSLMDIADEYQAVMVEHEEERYWESMEMWDNESRQRDAIRWVNERMQQQKINVEPPRLLKDLPQEKIDHLNGN